MTSRHATWSGAALTVLVLASRALAGTLTSVAITGPGCAFSAQGATAASADILCANIYGPGYPPTEALASAAASEIALSAFAHTFAHDDYQGTVSDAYAQFDSSYIVQGIGSGFVSYAFDLHFADTWEDYAHGFDELTVSQSGQSLLYSKGSFGGAVGYGITVDGVWYFRNASLQRTTTLAAITFGQPFTVSALLHTQLRAGRGETGLSVSLASISVYDSEGLRTGAQAVATPEPSTGALMLAFLLMARLITRYRTR